MFTQDKGAENSLGFGNGQESSEVLHKSESLAFIDKDKPNGFGVRNKILNPVQELNRNESANSTKRSII